MNMVDEVIDDLLLCGLRIGDKKAEDAAGDICWYIATGRASTSLIKAIRALKSAGKEKMLRAVLKTYGSTQDNVNACLHYMRDLAA